MMITISSPECKPKLKKVYPYLARTAAGDLALVSRYCAIFIPSPNSPLKGGDAWTNNFNEDVFKPTNETVIINNEVC